MSTTTHSDATCAVNTTISDTNASPLTCSQPAAEAKDICVQLQYLKDDPLYDTIKPLQIVPDWADTEGRTNVRLEAGLPETIHDVRGSGKTFSLDINGFSYIKAPTTFIDWASQQKIGSDHLPELEQLLRREVDGCDEILFYDARLRQETDEGVKVEGLSFKPFARQVHRDNTDSSVITKIRNLTEMKADYLLSGRARIINIWRPIKHPVYDCGLAIADGGKLEESDILECDRVKKDTGEFWDTMVCNSFAMLAMPDFMLCADLEFDRAWQSTDQASNGITCRSKTRQTCSSSRTTTVLPMSKPVIACTPLSTCHPRMFHQMPLHGRALKCAR